MPRYRSRSRSRSPVRRTKHYDDRRRDRRSPAPSGLLVRNISLSARPEDLREPFERFGPIKDVYLPKNYYTGEPRGFGFVKFRYPEDASEAKSHLNHTVIGGREIRIVFAEENRKTPHEMRSTTRVSSRGSHRRRSPSWSPRRRYHSVSRSPSPARHDSRSKLTKRDIKNSRLIKRNEKRGDKVKEGHGVRGDDYSSRRSRSVSRSVSPKKHRSHKYRERSPRLSRSLSRSRSLSPHNEKNHRTNHQSLSPTENDQTDYVPGKSQSPRRNSRSPASPH